MTKVLLPPYERTRSRSTGAVLKNWTRSGALSNPVGSCSSSPGALTYDWGIPYTAGGTYLTPYETETMVDWVTPGFKARLKKGEIINMPLTKTYQKVEEGLVDYLVSYMIQQYGCTPAKWYDWRQVKVSGKVPVSYFVPKPIVPTLSSSSADIAITSAYAQINASDLLVWGIIAEMNGTISGMKDILTSVYKIHRAVKRREFGILFGVRNWRRNTIATNVKSVFKSKQMWKDLADVYMNARYNLRPLYYDVLGIINVINHIDKKIERQTYRAASSDVKESRSSGTVLAHAHANQNGYIDYQTYVRRSYTHRAGVLAALEPWSLVQALGVELIPQTIWDLTTYSFILGWFCNVGDVIAAWSPSPHAKALASWIVTLDETVITRTVLGMRPVLGSYGNYRFTNHVFSASPAVSYDYKLVTTRKPSPERPILPDLTLKLDAAKLLDLGIILTNLKNSRSINNATLV